MMSQFFLSVPHLYPILHRPRTSPPAYPLISSCCYRHRISADLFQTYTPDLHTNIFAIHLTERREHCVPVESRILTPSPSPHSQSPIFVPRTRTSVSSSSFVSAQSTDSLDLDYLHEEPHQDVKVDLRVRIELGDGLHNIDVEALDVGVVVEDVEGRA